MSTFYWRVKTRGFGLKMKNIDKDTVKELLLGLAEIILLVFMVYFIASGYQNSIPLVDLLLIFISALLGSAFMVSMTVRK